MQMLDTAQGRMAYEASGSGRPLILLSANPGDHRDFSAVLPALAETHRVYAFDWPGYGQSPPPAREASAMLFADYLRAAMGALDLRNAILVGNSVGGYAAARLAIDEPSRVAALVLVSPGGFTPHNPFTRLFCRIQGWRWLKRPLVLPFARLYLRKRTATVVEILARAAGEQRTPAAVEANAGVWRSFIRPEHDLREAARRISAPTLVVGGRSDPVIRAKVECRIAAGAIPHARLEVFDTGHMPFAEDPQAFLDVVLPFLESLNVRAPSHAASAA
jgi:pimeloyl-ACP methyl ester carboxylesterase